MPLLQTYKQIGSLLHQCKRGDAWLLQAVNHLSSSPLVAVRYENPFSQSGVLANLHFNFRLKH